MKTGIYFDKKTVELLDRWARSKSLSRSSAVRFCVNSFLKGTTNRVKGTTNGV